MNDGFLEGIGPGLGAAYGPDDLRPVLCFGGSLAVLVLIAVFAAFAIVI